MDKTSYTIILTSNEPWGIIWYSKHHYANELSKSHLVIFLNPPVSWKIQDIIHQPFSTLKISDNLIVVNYRNRLPLRLFHRLFRSINNLSILNKTRRYIRSLSDNPVLLWQFDPFRIINVPKRWKWKRIYHVVDPYIHIQTDKRIAQNSDLVITTSKKYMSYYSKLNKRVIHIPHGTPNEKTHIQPHILKEIDETYGKFSILLGTINDDIDLSLLADISQNFNSNLVLIGPLILTSQSDILAFEELTSKENVFWLGALSQLQAMPYIAAANICLVPYKFDLIKSIGNRSPLKILNYIKFFRPVITSIDAEISCLEQDGIYWARSREEFLSLYEKGIGSKLSVNHSALEEYLKNVSYQTLLNKIFKNLSE